MRDIEDIIRDLNLFCIDNDYLQKLRHLTDEVLTHREKGRAVAAMFGIIERYPEEEIGSPGPLVHAIERSVNYERALLESIERQPATLTVFMLGRLIRKKPQEKQLWLRALRSVAENPRAGEMTKEDASVILSWHRD